VRLTSAGRERQRIHALTPVGEAPKMPGIGMCHEMNHAVVVPTRSRSVFFRLKPEATEPEATEPAATEPAATEPEATSRKPKATGAIE
jgi:hypothetical protein